ncbi:MAG: DUF1641 domain-containing protein [Burkholderiaceae bacterium]|nr:DUF1641 domain-containing protein [Burkholderiaceae bacterium]
MDTQTTAPRNPDGEIEGLVAAAQDALTDEMVGRLSATNGDGMALMDQISRAGLERAIPALAEMLNNDDLQRLVKLARVYGSAEDALTDEMVGRLTETVGNGLSLLDRFARGGADRVIGILESLDRSGALQQFSDTLPRLTERLARMQDMLGAIETAATATRRLPPSRGGVGGLWQLMRDPDSQDTLRFLLAVGKELRTAAT